MKFVRVGRIHLAVHGKETPSDEEWAAYIQDVEGSIDRIGAACAWTLGGGPTPKQRQATTEMWKRVGTRQPVAVCSNSAFVRGIVTALNWIMRQPMKAVSIFRLDEAFEHMGVSFDSAPEFAAQLRECAAELGISSSIVEESIASLEKVSKAS